MERVSFIPFGDLTKQLIQEHGFSFVAVEGDWPACYEVNRYIKGMAPEYSSAEDVLKKSFNRWPSLDVGQSGNR